MCRSWATGSQLTTHAWNKQCASRDMSSHWCFHYVFGNLQYSQILATMHPRSGWRTRPLSKSSAIFPRSCVDLHILSLKKAMSTQHFLPHASRWAKMVPQHPYHLQRLCAQTATGGDRLPPWCTHAHRRMQAPQQSDEGNMHRLRNTKIAFHVPRP